MLSLSQPTGVHFYSSDSLPHPTRREGVSCCVVVSCPLALSHCIQLRCFVACHCQWNVLLPKKDFMGSDNAGMMAVVVPGLCVHV